MHTSSTTIPRSLAAAALTLALVLAGCGDDDDSADTCEAAQGVVSAVSAVADLDLSADVGEQLSERLDTTRQSLDDLSDAASDQFGDEVDAVRDAVSAVGDALGGDASIGERVEAVQTAVGELTAAVDALGTAVTAELSDCDLGGA